MARVVLVSFYDFKSISTRLLHSILKKNGHQPKSIFFKQHRMDRMGMPSEREFELLVEAVSAAEPLFVGLSLRSTYATVAKEVFRRLSAAGHRVIWGGIHATVAPEDAIEHAHAVCVGEGDEAILDIVERLDSGKDLKGVPNLWVRENGHIHRSPLRPLVQNLDALPQSWWQPADCLYIEDDKVCDFLPPGFMTSFDIMTSRGCFYRCSYCLHSTFFDICRGLGKYVRRRSPEVVIDELRQAKVLFPNVSRVRFWDEIFTFDLEWCKRFTDMYRKEINLPFFCFTSANLAKPDILALLKVSGLRYVTMGIQSGSERVRKEVFNRPVPDKAVVRAAGIFKDLGFFPEYDLIIDNPFETEDDHVRSLELLLSLPRPYKLNQHSLTYFPNYGITKQALEAGYIKPEQIEHIDAKSLRRWHEVFDPDRDPREMFWGNVYFLTQFGFIPRGLIRRLAGSAFARAHARGFNALLKGPAKVLERGRTARFFFQERGLVGTVKGVSRKIAAKLRPGQNAA